jgi:hypothetical protein
MNLVLARSWERPGDLRRAAEASNRVTALGVANASLNAYSTREQSRILLAAGDTAGAWQAAKQYLRMRGKADASQKAIDDEVRVRVAAIEKTQR